ncbi:N-acetylmuramoyl-L-alanine amidase-like domain-containing protein, partial [Ochrobactrum sp. J50]
SQYIDNDVINNLHVGDYIGIYSPDYGMDVTHVGIYTKVNGVPTFRNASSLRANMKVVDSPFMDYVKNKPGIVVFRISGS